MSESGGSPAPRAERRLELDQPVNCTDGEFGTLEDVVVDPSANRVTHLVVEPRLPGQARLVPIELADPTAGEPYVRLRCTVEQAHQLPSVKQLGHLSSGRVALDDPDWDVGIHEVLMMPPSEPGGLVEYAPIMDPDVLVSYDRVPKGEVEIRRLSSVTSSDGHYVGHVETLILEEGRISHVVVLHGRLWWRRETTIPIDAIDHVGSDQVRLRISKQQVGALPSRARRRP